MGKNDKALESLQAALKIRRRQLGDCELVAITLEAIGDVYSNMYQLSGDLSSANESDKHYFESVHISDQIYGQHSTLANVLFKQALLKLRLHDTKEAVKLLTRCHAMRKKELGEQHPLAVLALYRLGCAQLDDEDIEGAAVSFEKIMETRGFESADIDGMSDNDIDIPAAFALAGQTLAKVDKLEMAEECFDESILAKAHKVGDSVELADFVEDIGAFFKEQRLEEESWAYYDKADAIRKRVSSDTASGGSDVASASYHGDIVQQVETYNRVQDNAEEELQGSGSPPAGASSHEQMAEDEPPAESKGDGDSDHDSRGNIPDSLSEELKCSQENSVGDIPRAIFDDEDERDDMAEPVAASAAAADLNQGDADTAANVTGAGDGPGPGAGIAAAAAAAAAAAVGIGALFGRNASTAQKGEKDEYEQNDGADKTKGSEMDNISLTKTSVSTINPEIQRLYEMGVISEAEFNEMIHSDRNYRHGDRWS